MGRGCDALLVRRVPSVVAGLEAIKGFAVGLQPRKLALKLGKLGTIGAQRKGWRGRWRRGHDLLGQDAHGFFQARDG